MTYATKPASERSFLDRYFGLSDNGTDVRTEFIAGLTTFLTMVYIVFVNPQILGNAGMDKGAVFVATCIAAAVSTLVMAFYANYPIALAPGMGLNAFFAFTVVLGHKYSWQQALAGVFCSGVIFFLISVFRIREYIINSIPTNLKLAISAGVGLFLGIIALEEAKIVVAQRETLVTLGDLTQWPAILCLLGFILIVALNYRNVIGSTLIGILVVAVIGLPLGFAQFTGVVDLPPSLAPTFLQLDFSRIAELTFIIVVFSFLMVDVFDNAGTLIGVAHRAGFLDKDGNLPPMKQALIADSFQRRVGAPLPIVAGEPRTAALVALESPSRPSLFLDAAPERSPWVTMNDIRAKGAIVIWPTTDTSGTPPAAIKERFPDLVPEGIPHNFERPGRLPWLLIGWALIRPQPSPEASTNPR